MRYLIKQPFCFQPGVTKGHALRGHRFI